MGIFDKNYEESSDKLWEDVKKNLKPKNGKKQVILLSTMTKSTAGLECDNKYTLQIGKVLDEMQNEGYEILDLKIETIESSMSTAAFIRTLIIYK